MVFADCTPIFLYDKEKNIIGNIHSGWQGTLNKIIKQAIIELKNNYKCNPKDIICAIGPTIRKCHFEVDEDVEEKFVKAFENYKKEEFIEEKIIHGKKKYNIDTVYLNKKMMLEMGIKDENIIDSKICTVDCKNLFHSYRAENEMAGRATAIICLK